MTDSFTSIREAIRTGIRTVTLPSKYILWAGMACPIVLLLLGASLWALLLFPLAALVSTIYTMWATPRWRIRAYETVGDIHQLQRSAELAGLLKLRSHERISGIMSHSQRRRLIALQERFAEDDTFVDDFSMPDETHLYQRSVSNPSAADEPIVTLNDSGIDVQSEGFFGWDQIQDERIARVSYTKRIFLPGMRIPAGSSALFRFEFPSDRIEIPLASLNVTIWELDLFLYIYRGRFNSRNFYPAI